MTTFTFEIEATRAGNIVNLGEADSLEKAFLLVSNEIKAAGTLITVQKLEVIEGRFGAKSYNHIETFEFETV